MDYPKGFERCSIVMVVLVRCVKRTGIFGKFRILYIANGSDVFHRLLNNCCSTTVSKNYSGVSTNFLRI